MSGLIDADAITSSNELATKIVSYNLTPYIKVDDLIDFIDRLPTIEADESTNGWIPISSGNLPDIYTQVLCCNDSGEVMVGRINWDKDSEDFVAWGRIGAYNDWMPQVVAWMPIVPYKEGEWQ